MNDNKIINNDSYETMNEFLDQAIEGLQTLPSNRGVIASKEDVKYLGEVRRAIHSLQEAISDALKREEKPNLGETYIPQYSYIPEYPLYQNLNALGQMGMLRLDVTMLDESYEDQLNDLEKALESVLKQHQPIDDVSTAIGKAKSLQPHETIHCTPEVYGEHLPLILLACEHDRNDRDVMSKVIAINPKYATHMGDALKSDDDFAMHVVKKYGVNPNDVSIFSSKSSVMKKIKDIKSNETIRCMPKVYGEYPPLILFACEHDRNDQGVMINVIAQNPNYAQHMGDKLKHDYDFAMYVIKKYGVNPNYFSSEVVNQRKGQPCGVSPPWRHGGGGFGRWRTVCGAIF